jgi:hypothetical protein
MSVSMTDLRLCSATTASTSAPVEIAFALIVGAAVFSGVLWLPVVLVDPDTLWHITTGMWILTHHAVPALDTYSFTAAGRAWVAHEWLSEVILAAAYGWAGWNGVMILTAAAAGSTIAFVAFYVARHVRIDIAVMLVLLATACGGGSLLARPHLLALPMVALWTIGLVTARARGVSPSLLLLPLMTVWANLHGGFMIGLALAGAFGVEALFDPTCRPRTTLYRWSIFGLGAVGAAMITPHGIDGLLFPFRLMAMKNLYSIQEWKPTEFGHLNGFALAILLALYLGLSGTLRLPKFRVLLVAGLVFSAMQHVRNTQLIGIIIPLLIANGLGRNGALPKPLALRVPAWMPTTLAGMVAAISLVVRIGLPVEREDVFYFASAALASVPDKLRTEPVLNEYGFGGLLIFNGVRPFVDGRADLYGDDFLDMYHAVTHAKGGALDETLCRYKIEWTMFSPDSVVPALMDRTPGWHRLFSDKVAVIHVRDRDIAPRSCTEQAGS